MKKSLAILLMLCILISSLTITASAAVQKEDTSATSGIDLVIVLDMTRSMKQDGTNRNSIMENDPIGYRFDAAAMLISMLDMDSSRVAVVPFADEPIEEKIIPLTSVDNEAARDKLIEQVYDLGDTKANTNIGAALMRANKILDERKNIGNDPMIMLLTDGYNNINGKIEISDSLRVVNRKIVSIGKETYTTKTANEVTKEAAKYAGMKNYPIYTIALNQDPSYAPDGGMSLQEISETSGLENGYYEVSANDASKLPEYFADVLAARIGSSVQFTANPKEIGDNLYEITIPVLNESVLEINIIIPTAMANIQETQNQGKGINANTIKVTDSTGKSPASSTCTIARGNENAHFAMVKIRNPQQKGLWKLTFSCKAKDFKPTDIAFNILYNYNIKLQASAESKTSRSDNSIYKSDTLDVTAWFTNEDGTESKDSYLYADHSNEADYQKWMNIEATWKLYYVKDNNRSLKLNGEMDCEADNHQFRAEVDLRQNNNIILPDGSYVLVINAQGAGLDRSVEIPLELKNHAPAAKDYEETLWVNNEEDEESWTVNGTSGTLDIKVSELITDEDGDNLKYTLKPVNDADKILKLELKNGQFNYKTIQKVENGIPKIASGDAVYELGYDDQYTGGSGSIKLTFHVISEVDETLDGYIPEITLNDTEKTDITCRKNSDLKLSVRLKEIASGSYVADKLNRIGVTIISAVNAAGEAVQYDENAQGDSKDFIFRTGNKAATWTITVKVGYFDEKTFTVNIPNDNAPVAAAGKTATINTNGGSVPSFLAPFIGTETADDSAEKNVDIEAENLFSDDDGDKLTYSAPAFSESFVSAKKSDDNDNLYHIDADSSFAGLFHYAAHVTMNITATDGNGEVSSPDYSRTLVIVDLQYKFLTYAAMAAVALVALVILILIIHQIRKPKFPRLTISITEEPSMYESAKYELVPVKTATNVNRCGVDAEMAAQCGVSAAQLLNVIIKPIRSSNAVGVVCKKIESGHEITINNGTALKAGKQTTWHLGDELRIKHSGDDKAVMLKLCEQEKDDQESEFVSSTWDADEWSSDADMPKTVKPKKSGLFKGNAKKAKQAAEEKQEDTWGDGNNDGFSF